MSFSLHHLMNQLTQRQNEATCRVGEDGGDLWHIFPHLPDHRTLHYALHTETRRVSHQELCQPGTADDDKLPPNLLVCSFQEEKVCLLALTLKASFSNAFVPGSPSCHCELSAAYRSLQLTNV